MYRTKRQNWKKLTSLLLVERGKIGTKAKGASSGGAIYQDIYLSYMGDFRTIATRVKLNAKWKQESRG